MKGLSQIHAYIHSPPNSPPIQAAIEHFVEFYVLHSKSLLVIYFKYSSVYMPVPNPLIIPSLHRSPLAPISSFSKAVSLFLFCKFICNTFFFFFLRFPCKRDVIGYFSFSV